MTKWVDEHQEGLLQGEDRLPGRLRAAAGQDPCAVDDDDRRDRTTG